MCHASEVYIDTAVTWLKQVCCRHIYSSKTGKTYLFVNFCPDILVFVFFLICVYHQP